MMKYHIETQVLHRHQGALVGSQSLAAVWTGVLLLQLFGYEDFVSVVDQLIPAEFAKVSATLTALIVMIELFGLAYYLPLALSRLAQGVARAFALLTPLIWLLFYINNTSRSGLVASALLGGHEFLEGGIVILAAFGLLVMAVAIVILDYRRSVPRRLHEK